jgi:hypothetical protein
MTGSAWFDTNGTNVLLEGGARNHEFVLFVFFVREVRVLIFLRRRQ